MSVVGAAFRAKGAELGWGATAIALGVALGVGIALLLR
jgi:hypothetical protein